MAIITKIKLPSEVTPRDIVDSGSVRFDSTQSLTQSQKNVALNNIGAVSQSMLGANNGIATLDSAGKVPSSQLPSFVDDIIEGYFYNNNFYSDSAHTQMITAESSKIYIDIPTNAAYRWSGSFYVKIVSDVVLGTSHENAYYGDFGNIAYQHSLSPHTLVESSSTNGHIKINNVETVVYDDSHIICIKEWGEDD